MTRKIINGALNGVTGRMGYRQHLVRSLLSIRETTPPRQVAVASANCLAEARPSPGPPLPWIRVC